MKIQYLEMLHTEFEVSSSISMAVREIIRLEYKKIRKIRKTRRLDYQNIGRLEIMKVQYLEMQHTEFEASSSNSMAVREIKRLEYKKIRKIGKTRRLDDQNIRRLKIMKLEYREMLHNEFEVSSTNSMPVRGF